MALGQGLCLTQGDIRQVQLCKGAILSGCLTLLERLGLQPEEIDLAVIPCCTCSHTGKRLGYGGGYYDRYLGRVEGMKAVICRERIMRDDIPVEEHDQAVDMVISEGGTWRMT